MTINPYRTESRFEWPLLMQWTAPIQRHREALEMRRVNVCLWLQADSLRGVPERLLSPRQQTFQPPLPLSHRFRLLLGYERTYGGAVCRVRC